MLRFLSENYERDERTYVDKDGDAVDNSYRLLLVAHNDCDFDVCFELESSVNEITGLKNIKTAKRLICLSFQC